MFTSGFVLMLLSKYRKFYRYQVESVIYNTKSKEFTLAKRNAFWVKREQKLPKDKLLYTSDQQLNSIRINYLNIDTLECYGIGFDMGWKNKELFSHLL